MKKIYRPHQVRKAKVNRCDVCGEPTDGTRCDRCKALPADKQAEVRATVEKLNAKWNANWTAGMTKLQSEFDETLRQRQTILSRQRIGEPSKDGDLASYSTLDLLAALQTSLGELSARALNDPVVAESLFGFAAAVCRDLWEVCEKKPDVVRPFAAKKMCFPTNWPLLKEHQKTIFKMMDSLGVGTGAIYRLPRNAKQFNPNTPANRLVLGWVELIHEKQREIKLQIVARHTSDSLAGRTSAMSASDYVEKKTTGIKEPRLKQIMSLPPLNSACADDWANAIWEMILVTYDGKPENDPELHKIGKYRERHSEYIEQQKKTTPQTCNSNVRDGIKERISKAVRALAG